MEALIACHLAVIEVATGGVAAEPLPLPEGSDHEAIALFNALVREMHDPAQRTSLAARLADARTSRWPYKRSAAAIGEVLLGIGR